METLNLSVTYEGDTAKQNAMSIARICELDKEALTKDVEISMSERGIYSIKNGKHVVYLENNQDCPSVKRFQFRVNKLWFGNSVTLLRKPSEGTSALMIQVDLDEESIQIIAYTPKAHILSKNDILM
jgi:hypothetical protein